jgi:uncharacterized membrane protein
MLGITLLAMAARLTHLEARSLWVDEGITYARATLPWNTVVSQLLLVLKQTPLYYGVMQLWTRVAGLSSFALRFPSVLAGTFAVPVTYIVGKRADSQHTGLLAAAMLVLNPFHLWYSQEARMYALSILASAGILIAFTQALKHSGRYWWAVLALISSIAYLVHFFTWTLAAAQFVVILMDLRRLHLRFRCWVVAQVVAALPATLWVMNSLVRRGTTRLGGGWIPRPDLLAPLYTFFNYSLGYEREYSPLLLLGWVLFLAAFGLAFRYQTQGRWRQTLLAWMGVPVAATYLISLRRPCYLDRYLSIVLPSLLIWVALGVKALPYRCRLIGSTALLVATACAGIGVLSGARYQKEDWRSAISQVCQMAHPDDQMLVASPEDLPVCHYYLQGVLPVEVGLLQQSPEGRYWFLYRIPTESNHLLGEPAGFSLAEEADPEVRAWLRAHGHQLSGQWDYPGLALFRLEGK